MTDRFGCGDDDDVAVDHFNASSLAVAEGSVRASCPERVLIFRAPLIYFTFSSYTHTHTVIRNNDEIPSQSIVFDRRHGYAVTERVPFELHVLNPAGQSSIISATDVRCI